MATTTNYSWETPDDTDLVKDGAAAIRTLGSSIDTTTKALNPSTTLGDIEYRSSTANTNTRLPIGTTGQILTVAGGVPSWASAASGGGMTLLTTVSLSGSSVTSATFSSSYKRLFMYLYKGVNSELAEIRMRLNTDTGSNYSNQQTSSEGSTNYAAGSTSSTSASLGVIGTTTNDKLITHGFITIDNPSNTDTVFINTNMLCYDGTNMRRLAVSSIYDSTAAITSATFFPGGGTFSSGSVLIYGVN